MSEPVFEPELIDVLNLHKNDIFASFNCHAIATIQSYDKATKTCKATIVYKKIVQKQNPATRQLQNALEDYPVLINVPVINVSGGTGGIRFPIAKNDVALIMFNDRDIDSWFLGLPTNGKPNTKRMHQFSDGVALVGVFSKNDAMKDYQKLGLDKDKTILYDGDAKIVLSNNRIKISNKPVDVDTLGMLLFELLTVLSVLAPVTTIPTQPTIPNPAQTAAIISIQTRLQGLLE